MEPGIITGVRLVNPGEEIREGAIHFGDDGRIAAIDRGQSTGGRILADGGREWFAFPGFIDLHTHGADGADLSLATVEAVKTIAKAKLREGVTTFLPTTWTASPEALREMASALAGYRREESYARAPSLHVEGPYLNPTQAGAQDPRWMRLPDVAEIDVLRQICPIGLVSLAIELEGALGFIEAMRERDIVTSAAHSAATYEIFRQARRAGLGHLTHFCNQMSPLHHREVGLVGAGFLDDEVRLELICDTVHLCEDMIELIFRHRSRRRIMLITDSIAASHLGDGEYPLQGSVVRVIDGVARIPQGNLAGSTLRFDAALRHAVRITGRTLSEIAFATGANQAESLGLTDRGHLRAGMLGDVVLMNRDLQVEQVFVGGELRHTSR